MFHQKQYYKTYIEIDGKKAAGTNAEIPAKKNSQRRATR